MARLRLIVLVAAAFLLGGLLGWRGSRLGAEPGPVSGDAPPAPQGNPAASPASPPSATSSAPGLDESYQYILLFSRVMQIVRQDYVDPSKVGYKDLTYAALRGMLSSLDPHSQFLDEEAFADLQRETQGGPFTGLGIIVGIKNESTVIVSPMDGSPAANAGLLPGDRILRINGRSTEHLSLATVGDLLKGAAGEKATLTILRPNGAGAGDGQVFEKTLTREVIQLQSVKDPGLLPARLAGPDKIGYLRIEEFGQNTAQEFDRALDGLEAQGLQALVIDLRNNPGGVVDAAVDVTGEFIPANAAVVSLKGRSAAQDQVFRAKGDRQRGDYPVVLLINGYSASAAEIMSGALQDMKRAVLVGEQTFGKGSVQTVQSLDNGIGLRLTTAKYFTPSGRSIQEVGIVPDIAVPITNIEERRIILSEAKRALTAEEKSEAAQADDRQLQRAVSALRAVRVYRAKQEQLHGSAPATNAAP
jgi:carboxyl-terminal processing protease